MFSALCDYHCNAVPKNVAVVQYGAHRLHAWLPIYRLPAVGDCFLAIGSLHLAARQITLPFCGAIVWSSGRGASKDGTLGVVDDSRVDGERGARSVGGEAGDGVCRSVVVGATARGDVDVGD